MHDWSPYLKPADYEYLNQYIENVKNGVPNSKMILLAGEPGTGKSTLMDDIERYLGDKLFGDLPTSRELIHNENIKKLGFLRGLDAVGACTDTYTQSIIDLIKRKQSFIASVQDELNMSFDLMDHCYMIQMSHVF